MKNYKLKIALCSLIIAILLLSGCTEMITDLSSDMKKQTDSFFESEVKKIESNLMEENTNLIKGISKLPILNNDTIDTFGKYQNFAGSVNTLFKFLNREGGYDFQLLKGTRSEYEKISKFITEYGPLIDNYNSVIIAARNYNENDSQSVKEYYKALGILGVEFSIIYATVWYSPTYKAVGLVYRGSGLNRLAFKCPTLISFILKNAHWGLRNILVDKTSDAVEFFISELEGT